MMEIPFEERYAVTNFPYTKPSNPNNAIIGPTYYVGHPDGSFTPADPQPSLRAPQSGPPELIDATILEGSPAVTRVELIDHRHGAPRAQRGRVFVALNASVALSYQDGGRTLKIFVADRAGSGAETPPQPETP